MSLLEACWTAAFVYALGRSLIALGVVTRVRSYQTKRGVNSPVDLFFVRLTWLLVVGSIAGLVPGLYAAAVPPGGAPPGSPLSVLAGVLVPLGLVVLGSTIVLIARELVNTYNRVTRTRVPLTDVSRPGGRRWYDRIDAESREP